MSNIYLLKLDSFWTVVCCFVCSTLKRNVLQNVVVATPVTSLRQQGELFVAKVALQSVVEQHRQLTCTCRRTTNVTLTRLIVSKDFSVQVLPSKVNQGQRLCVLERLHFDKRRALKIVLPFFVSILDILNGLDNLIQKKGRLCIICCWTPFLQQ